MSGYYWALAVLSLLGAGYAIVRPAVVTTTYGPGSRLLAVALNLGSLALGVYAAVKL